MEEIFIAVIILLVSSSVFGSYFWYQLNVTKNQLAETEVQLENILVELDTTKSQLNDTETLLNTTQIQLVDTEAQLGTTQAQLDVSETKLDMTENRLETEKTNDSKMLNQYTSLKGQVNARWGDTPEDKQNFINPSTPLVSGKVLEITGGYSEDVSKILRDYKRLYGWVVSNISYSYDSYMPILPENISGGLIWQQDYWRTPEETLGDETGDCEDMAVLLASMLRGYNEGEYQIWILEIRSSIPGEPAHVAVAFPVQGGRLTILDPAGNYYTGQYGSLDSSSVSNAVSKWLSHWQRDMPDAEIVRAFSEDVYEEFSSIAEFVT